jgi:hypothetical protein
VGRALLDGLLSLNSDLLAVSCPDLFRSLDSPDDYDRFHEAVKANH